MMHSKIPVAQSIVALCLSKNITHVVISPGSRNAPLTIEFSEHPEIFSYSIVDERCAAFVALGMALKLQKPVAVLCTSGSALLNYYPAVAEAFYSDIPLVILSADRPIERIDIGDGQTIRQKNLFENHILYSANLYSEAVPEQLPLDKKLQQKQWESHRHNEQEINKALNIAIEESGPVHINVPFYEPLYNTTTKLFVKPIEVLPDRLNRQPIKEELQPYLDIWTKAKRKLILIGVQQPGTILQEYIETFANDDSVVVMTETTSNVHHKSFISNIDSLIAPIEQQEDARKWFGKLQPEVLLTFGGFIISKKIKAFLRNYQPKHHWHVDQKKAYNTYFCLEKHFEYTPNDFLKMFMANYQPTTSKYFEFWNGIKNYRLKAQQHYIKTTPFSDFSVFQQLLGQLPEYSKLHLSNSSTIRYAQLFSIHKSIDVYCNRGTSGIDGSSSTAIGFSMVSREQNILITGDLSFFYDSNALWNTHIPNSFRIIVINNNGGGIFRILPGNKDTHNFETYFETTHQLNAKPLCELYGFEYRYAENSEDLEKKMPSFFEPSKMPKLLEIKTPRTLNDNVLMDYFKSLKS